MKISVKILLTVWLLIIVYALISLTISYETDKAALLRGIDEKLYTSALMLKEILPADYHENIDKRNSLHPGYYEKLIVDRNDRLCRALKLQYLWSCMLVDGKIVFTTSTSPDKDVSKHNYARFFDVHRDPRAFDRVFSTMHPVYSSFHNEWGNGRMVLVPFLNNRGIPYCFCASISTADVALVLNRLLVERSVIMLIMLVAGFVGSVVLARTISLPIEKLTGIANDIARGNLDQKVEVSGGSEIASLSDSIATMCASLKLKIAELDEKRRDLTRAQRIARLGNGEWDIPTDRVSCSDEVYALTGIAFGTPLTPTVLAACLHPGDLAALKKELSGLLRQGSGLSSLSFRILRPDGSLRHIVAHGELTADSSGAPRKMFLTVQDITDLKRLEEEKEDLIAELRRRTTELESAHAELSGRAEQLASANEELEVTNDELHTRGEELESANEELQIANEELGGITRELAAAKKELEGLTRDLEAKVAERTRAVEEMNRTLKDEVVAHQETEQRLFEARNHLDRIINSVADPIFVKDRQHRWIMLNDAFCGFMGYRREEVIGKSDYDFFPKKEADVFWEKDEMVFTSGKENINEENFTDAKGRVHVILTKKTLFKDELGQKILVGIITDITERKRHEEEIERLNRALTSSVAQLEAANRDLDSFTYSVSHDLRAPLRAIDGFTNILREESAPKLNAEEGRLLGIIHANTLKMSRLIDDLLTFSHLGRQRRSLARINMEEIARSVFDELLPSAAGRKLDFKLSRMPHAFGDAAMLRQVFVNLFSNALKFTKDRPVAFIEAGSLALPSREAAYFVRDNGVGYDMSYGDKLFKVFSRLHQSSQFEGTGVGLAIVQRIVQKHGGRTWAEGSIGHGATFYFTLGQRKEVDHDKKRSA